MYLKKFSLTANGWIKLVKYCPLFYLISYKTHQISACASLIFEHKVSQACYVNNLGFMTYYC